MARNTNEKKIVVEGDSSSPTSDQFLGYLTRIELSEKSRVSMTEIRRREAAGTFRGPVAFDRSGPGSPKALYELSQVNELRSTSGERKREAVYTAEEAKKSFAIFNEKKQVLPALLVLEVGVHPHAAMVLARDYAEANLGLFLSGKTLEEINKLSLDGCFPLTNEEDLLDVLKDFAGMRCRKCKKERRVLCRGCATEARKSSKATAPSSEDEI